MTPLLSKTVKFLGYGAALALLMGAVLYRVNAHPPEWAVVVTAALVTIGAGVITRMPGIFRHVTPNPEEKPAQRPVFAEEAPSNTRPRYNSRRYARMMFHNGVITIEELSRFYDEHPEDTSDSDR